MRGAAGRPLGYDVTARRGSAKGGGPRSTPETCRSTLINVRWALAGARQLRPAPQRLMIDDVGDEGASWETR
ncbi:hypothetical protein [Micromonospora sp. NPDC049679]|uniref:hypothetical protein n=1 Tax=Micromonospora sp. NPDC049679 TaxID=3155920 RepID=UPI0033C54158